jgi:Domain of unknown function (DUF4939)
MADADDPATSSSSETPRNRPTVATLNEEVKRLLARVQELEEAGQPPTPPVQPSKEPKLGEPPTYDGKAAEFHPFLQQCKLYIRMKPITFALDDARVAYILSRLRGTPAEWGQALLEATSPLLTDYNVFLARFTSVYENKERRRQLEYKLARMEQTGSAHTFSAEFTSLCEILGVDERTRRILFMPKLKLAVRKSLALAPTPPTFDELVELAVRADDINFIAEKAEKAEKSRNNASSKPQKPQNPPNSQSSFSRLQQPRNHSSPPSTNATSSPLTNRRGPLSDKEKERRKREGLCGYCAEAHAFKDCPALKAKEAREAARNESTNSAVSSVVIPFGAPDNSSHNSGKFNPQSQ